MVFTRATLRQNKYGFLEASQRNGVFAGFRRQSAGAHITNHVLRMSFLYRITIHWITIGQADGRDNTYFVISWTTIGCSCCLRWESFFAAAAQAGRGGIGEMGIT
jgi:hypothetical protein